MHFTRLRLTYTGRFDRQTVLVLHCEEILNGRSDVQIPLLNYTQPGLSPIALVLPTDGHEPENVYQQACFLLDALACLISNVSRS